MYVGVLCCSILRLEASYKLVIAFSKEPSKNPLLAMLVQLFLIAGRKTKRKTSPCPKRAGKL